MKSSPVERIRQEFTRRLASSPVMAATRPAPHRFEAPVPPTVEEVTAEELQMLQRAEEVFARNPGLERTYKTAESFGRKCLAAARTIND